MPIQVSQKEDSFYPLPENKFERSPTPRLSWEFIARVYTKLTQKIIIRSQEHIKGLCTLYTKTTNYNSLESWIRFSENINITAYYQTNGLNILHHLMKYSWNLFLIILFFSTHNIFLTADIKSKEMIYPYLHTYIWACIYNSFVFIYSSVISCHIIHNQL